MWLCACLANAFSNPDWMRMQGKEIEGPGEGFLCAKAGWPSTLRSLFGDHERYETTYFAPFKVMPLQGVAQSFGPLSASMQSYCCQIKEHCHALALPWQMRALLYCYRPTCMLTQYSQAANWRCP